MPRMDKLSNYKTTVATVGDHVTVTYQKTAIVRFNDSEVILDSGGWETVTTKRKMNQAANQFGLPYGVYQKDYIWYVSTAQGDVLFRDGMVINRKSGQVKLAA